MSQINNKTIPKTTTTTTTKVSNKDNKGVLTRNTNKENQKPRVNTKTKEQHEKEQQERYLYENNNLRTEENIVSTTNTDNGSSDTDSSGSESEDEDKGNDEDKEDRENESNSDKSSVVSITINGETFDKEDEQNYSGTGNIIEDTTCNESKNITETFTNNNFKKEFEENSKEEVNKKTEEKAKDTDVVNRSRRINFTVSNETIYFNARSKKYSFMSNFYPSKLFIDGKEYWHVEGYFQSQKFSGVNKVAEEHIQTAMSPALSRKVAHSYPLIPSRKKEWDEGLRDSVMRRAVFCKFLLDKNLTELLVSTGNVMLVEDNPHDNYWASGSGGRGLNKLGTILMVVRDFLNQLN